MRKELLIIVDNSFDHVETYPITRRYIHAWYDPDRSILCRRKCGWLHSFPLSGTSRQKSKDGSLFKEDPSLVCRFSSDGPGDPGCPVFFIPDKSRITYIDLPACRDKLVLSAMIAGPVSAIIGSAALFAAGSTPSIPHQIAAGILLLALAALGKIMLKKNSGKGDSAS